MRFLMMIKADKDSERGAPPNPKLMAAMEKFVEGMVRSGVLLVTGRLGPSASGTRLVASGGKLAQVDGPFAETKELIAGFAIIQVKSKEEALEHGRRFMKLHQDVLGPTWEGVSEVREIFGPE